MFDVLSTGYDVSAGSAILADRMRPELATCECGETTAPNGTCLNVGDCRHADRQASRSSLRRGSAASSRPAAWTFSGRVD